MSDIVALARALATLAHAHQVDKAGRPYIEHVARVAAAVADDPATEAVAWLHDVFEDSPEHRAAASAILEAYGLVPDLEALTYHRGQPKAVYYAEIRKRPIARRVKLADIADNGSEERLALLDEATSARLRLKYANAMDALTS